MSKERNCQKCIHHISGLCCKWDCEMQTLEDYRDKAIDEFAERVITQYHQLPTTLGYTEQIIREIAEQMKAGE